MGFARAQPILPRYVTAAGRRVVVVRVFIKKTRKTPPRELEIARQRAKEVA
ncbi:MAG: type II toxin-antitoxin system RelE/ParE family toxin [Xanthobacteraceae bacterium]|jgi:phage-related protein